MDIFGRYLWRVIFTVLGLAVAISCMTLGFFKTLLILLCCVIGYIIGVMRDKNIKMIEVIRLLQNRR